MTASDHAQRRVPVSPEKNRSQSKQQTQ